MILSWRGYEVRTRKKDRHRPADRVVQCFRTLQSMVDALEYWFAQSSQAMTVFSWNDQK
jgi:hypothetical protein